jgi:phosphonate transport system substrate-binding protein
VILAVQAGQYDIGSVREGALAVLADRIDPEELRVIGRTGWYPGWVYAARDGLDPQIVARVGQVLMALDAANPQQRGILEKAHIKAIVPSQDRDFDPVRDLWTRVGGERLDCRTAAANQQGQSR